MSLIVIEVGPNELIGPRVVAGPPMAIVTVGSPDGGAELLLTLEGGSIEVGAVGEAHVALPGAVIANLRQYRVGLRALGERDHLLERYIAKRLGAGRIGRIGP